jgi:hypothetical protein
MMGQQQQQTMESVAEKEVVRSLLRRTTLALITAALVVAMLAALGADPASAKNSRDRINTSSSGNILNSSHDNTANDGGPTGGGPAVVEHDRYSAGSSSASYDFVETEVSTPSGYHNFNRVGNLK